MSHLTASGSNGHISPMELESLANGNDSYSKSNRSSPMAAAATTMGGEVREVCQRLGMLLRLYFELYPKAMMGASAGLVGLLLFWWSPWTAMQSRHYMRNYMTHDYTTLQDNFNFKTAQIDHWCLFGGDDKCYCEDPTEPMDRGEVKGWQNAHKRNLWLATQAVRSLGPDGIDVVFLGDQTVQAWDGFWLDRMAPEGNKVAAYFNKTFHSKDSTFQGVALGMYGDRINNILWRIKHEIQVLPALYPKVFWLIMGTNDLALGLCSEEVVTLGIMRVAEELHHLCPDSIIVIQGILPRSNHPDGTLEGKTSKYAERGRGGIINNKTRGFINRNNPKRKVFKDNVDYDPTGGIISQVTNPFGGRDRSLLEDKNHNHHQHDDNNDLPSYYNPMDQFLDNYLEHYDDANFTTQLMNDFWGPHFTDSDDLLRDDDVDQQSAMGRRLQDLTTPVVEKPGKKKAKDDADGEEADATLQKTAGGSIITAPKQSYTYEDNGKILPSQTRAPPPRFDFYLWPSIKAINKELEGFCAKHEHFVYFDADDLVLGSIGNSHFRAEQKHIIKELMANYKDLSFAGHKVLMDVVNDELKRILLDDDEGNDIETKNGGKIRH